MSLIFLKRSLVFPILFFPSISLHGSLKKAFLSLLAILWNSVLKWVYLSFSPLPFTYLLFSAICKASSDNHFAFLHFFFLGGLQVCLNLGAQTTSIGFGFFISWFCLHALADAALLVVVSSSGVKSYSLGTSVGKSETFLP